MSTVARELYDQSLPVHESPPSVPDNAVALAEMVEWIDRVCPKSGAEALRELRVAFPYTPLTLRVEALHLLIRRQGGTLSYTQR